MKITRSIFSMIVFAGSFSPVLAQNPAARPAALATTQGFSNPTSPSAPLVPVAAPTPMAPVPVSPPAIPGPAANASVPQQADALLARSQQMLDQIGSLSAKIRNQVDLFDHQISGAGQYLQQGRGAQRLSRFELKSQAG